MDYLSLNENFHGIMRTVDRRGSHVSPNRNISRTHINRSALYEKGTDGNLDNYTQISTDTII